MVSSGGISDCDILFIKIGARQGEFSCKLNFGVGTRGGYEPSEDCRLETAQSLFKPGVKSS